MPADAAKIDLRPEEAADEPFLLELYESTRARELDAAGFPAALRAQFLKMQFAAQRTGYRATFPRAAFVIITLNDRAAGRLIVDRGEGEIRLVDIALLPEHRGGGIGSMLVKNLQREAACTGRPLRLSAIRGEGAARLYSRLGFTKTGEADFRDLMEWRAGGPPAGQ